MNKRPNMARLTVVEEMSFYDAEGVPTASAARFTRKLATDEQPWVRRLEVGEDWVPINAGWIKEASQVRIENREGQDMQVIPTPEERADMEARVVEVATVLLGEESPIRPHALIPPGEDARYRPYDCRALLARSRHQTARIMVYLYPL